MPSKNRFFTKRRFIRYGKRLGIALVGFVIFSALAMAWYAYRTRHDPEVVGVTFSQVQAERFGTDWQANYTALLDDLKFRHFRLVAYWDRIEPQQNQFDWRELDWMFEQAQERGAKITLTIGQKVPRWPECYYPSWLDKDDTRAVRAEVSRMLTAVIERYRHHPALEAWQLENEFLLRSYGRCPGQNLTRSMLRDELATVRRTDANHPIVLTQSDQFGMPIFGPFADWFGFSMYRHVYNEGKGYWTYPQPGLHAWWKASIISLLTGNQIKVHELQAEAWGRTGNEFLFFDETQKTMNPALFDDNIRYVRDTKIKRYDLWGAEWWWFLKTREHQPAMWDRLRQFMQDGKV